MAEIKSGIDFICGVSTRSPFPYCKDDRLNRSTDSAIGYENGEQVAEAASLSMEGRCEEIVREQQNV